MPLKNNSKWAGPIAKRYQKGESVREIALATGLTENTVKSYLSVMKVPRDEKRLEIGTPEADAWAEKCGVSKNTVWMSVAHRKKRGTRTRFVKVEIDDETEEKQ